MHGITQAEVHRIINENSVHEFYKLEGVPGYRLATLSWQEASGLVNTGTYESLGTLGRHPSAIVIYWSFKAKVAPADGAEFLTARQSLSTTFGLLRSSLGRSSRNTAAWLTMSQPPYWAMTRPSQQASEQ